MKPKNKKIINNFCNYLLNLGFEDKMELNSKEKIMSS